MMPIVQLVANLISRARGPRMSNRGHKVWLLCYEYPKNQGRIPKRLVAGSILGECQDVLEH